LGGRLGLAGGLVPNSSTFLPLSALKSDQQAN
jgi:hypothetical protein